VPVKVDARRRVVFRLVAAVGLPLLLLCLVEVGLRVAGYGYPTAFFRPLRIGNEEFLVENEKFGWRFFPPEISRSPSPMRLRMHKAPGTYRIFLLGESAALGDPEPAYGMGRYLQALLQERYPETRFEVVSAAMTAINSHAVLPIARECARQAGDLWIVYMGNNEMIGPFGAITVFGAQSPPLWYTRFSIAVQRTRFGQLLVNLGRRLTGKAGDHGPSWGGMQMFVKNQILPEDRRKEQVYAGLERNLEDILRAGRSVGVPIILSSVAVNLKDCAPFGTLTETNSLTSADLEKFQKLSQEGAQAQARGELSQAAARFEEAGKIRSHSAELQFRWGQSLLGLTNIQDARTHFEQARDDDSLPFRTDSRMNEIIRHAANQFAGPDLVFLDAAALAATNSLSGIAGDELFYEHVHYDFDGNYWIARALAETIARLLPQGIARAAKANWASQETCEQDLGLTDWNRREVYDNMKRRMLQPPFTLQPANAQKARHFEQLLEQIRPQLAATNAEPARKIYCDAISRWPEDFRLHMNYAAFLEAVRDWEGAVAEWKTVQGLIPHHYLACFQIGRLLALQGQGEAARPWLSKALALRPDLSEGWYELGRVQASTGQLPAAVESLIRAQKLVPAAPHYHTEMARVLLKLKRDEDALAELREATRSGAASWDAHYLLGEQLAFANRVQEAEHEFEEAIRLNPTYPLAHLNLGIALAKRGQFPRARSQFEEVLRLQPQNETAKRALAEIDARHR
jgi:tetratricopeptide (TPR) repeat protein